MVIIARGLQAAELGAVAPAGLFAFSSYAEPAALPQAGALSPVAVAWL